MDQTKVRESQLPWADLSMPGVTMKVLHKDDATGAMAVLTRMEPGAVIPAHWHTQADETAGDCAELRHRDQVASGSVKSRRLGVPTRKTD